MRRWKSARLSSRTPASTDGVAKLRHETRGLSDDHDDGVAAARHRVDAIFTKLKFGNVRKDAESLTRMRRDVVASFCLLLFGHVRVFGVAELLVICEGRER